MDLFNLLVNRSLGAPAARVPVSLLTGCLGSGKTTLLAQLLRQPTSGDRDQRSGRPAADPAPARRGAGAD
ncbi:GTP-binding protein [uncultured Thiodictyon sp.]|uniref:GTP-binding protein n=1 Tax=uncultured Thiodictyon sp. TaxID=1846217 RepID=UPI00345A2479